LSQHCATYSTFGISQQDIVVVDNLWTQDVIHSSSDGVDPHQEGHLVHDLCEDLLRTGDVEKHIALSSASSSQQQLISSSNSNTTSTIYSVAT
jgi:hypothetical protein